MLNLCVPTILCNAAAAVVSRWGAVSERARQAGCSRQTIYNDTREVCARLQGRDHGIEQLRAQCTQLCEENQRLKSEQQRLVAIEQSALKRFAVTAQAEGVSLRVAETLLRTVLPAQRVPDHTTMGRWTQEAGRRAGEVLAVLDPWCAPLVETACIDEIFFGG